MNKLREWLDKHGARVLWETEAPQTRITAYCLRGGAVCLVHRYNEHGWQLYVPPDQGNSIASTLDAAERILELVPVTGG